MKSSLIAASYFSRVSICSASDLAAWHSLAQSTRSDSRSRKPRSKLMQISQSIGTVPCGDQSLSSFQPPILVSPPVGPECFGDDREQSVRQGGAAVLSTT